jgi:hypothetical protein
MRHTANAARAPPSLRMTLVELAQKNHNGSYREPHECSYSWLAWRQSSFAFGFLRS